MLGTLAWNTDANGDYLRYYQTNAVQASLVGTWTYYAVDDATGTRSNDAVFTITP